MEGVLACLQYLHLLFAIGTHAWYTLLHLFRNTKNVLQRFPGYLIVPLEGEMLAGDVPFLLYTSSPFKELHDSTFATGKCLNLKLQLREICSSALPLYSHGIALLLHKLSMLSLLLVAPNQWSPLDISGFLRSSSESQPQHTMWHDGHRLKVVKAHNSLSTCQMQVIICMHDPPR